ncbi:MAG: CapA family protein [Armatimonadota bacterium]
MRSQVLKEASTVLLVALVLATGVWLMYAANDTDRVREWASQAVETFRAQSRGSAEAAGGGADAQPISILLVGDVLPRDDREYFPHVRSLIQSADFAVGNLESPISTEGSRTALKLTPGNRTLPNEYFFRAPPVQARRIADAGFDAMTLANNHIMDYGAPALEQTLALLDDVGVSYAGAGSDRAAARKPAFANVGGQTIAVLAYVDADTLPATTHFAASDTRAGTVFVHGDGDGDPQQHTLQMLREDIGAAREQADFVIVAFHWGTESKDTPDPLQRNLAHRSIEAGADLIVGHHPHVLQGVEIYGGRPIVYSLGNFAFPTPWKNTQLTGAVRIDVENGDWTKLTWHPVRLEHNTGIPAPAAGIDAQRIISRLKRLSGALGTRYQATQDQSAPLWLAHERPQAPDEESFVVEQHPEIDRMSTVRFLAWDLEDRRKVARERSVVVHQKLADEVLAIFREIFEADERFPIHEVIGYDYRTVAGSGSGLSNHALGRAVDINRAENPMIEGGEKIVHRDEPPYEPGEWRPGEDPYSIPPDGSVVEAFKSHGWRWGGDWTSLKDYQHFDKPR